MTLPVIRAIEFSISLYIGLVIFNSIIPLLTLTSSIKSTSLAVSSVYLDNVKSILSLSAPAAFSFVVPEELSKRLVSSAEDKRLSAIVRPTLYVGLPEYFSKINVCASTLQKNPLANIIPSDILAIEERPTGLSVLGLIVNSLLLALFTVTVPSSPNVHSCNSSPE